MNWYLEPFRKFVDFSGRARRKEYWTFNLLNILISIGLLIVDMQVGTFDSKTGAGLLNSVFSLVVLLPGLGVSVRRLHDTDHSGWWLLILLVPLVGVIVLLIFLVRDSQPGSNRFGPNPKRSGVYKSSAPREFVDL